MTAPSTIRSGVGLRHVQILAIAADDYPAAVDTSAYAGATISGARALSITDPEPRQIIHQGDDGIFALDSLPPTEPISGELRTSKVNDVVDAIIGDDKSVTVGEAKLFPEGTDQRGNENQVIMLAYRQTLDTDPDSANFGARRWEFRLIPRALLIARDGPLDENPEERLYAVRPQFATKYPWGVAFATTTEGCTRAQMFRGISQYKPKLIAFKGDNATVAFAFPTAAPAADVAKVQVWVNGSPVTPSTVTVTNFTLASTPSTDANVVVFYEVS